MVTQLEALFPRLDAGNYQITSPPDARYNCIAWAVGDSARWWWPELDPQHGHWPEGVPAAVTVAAFLAAFASLGYTPADREEVEAG
jgi:hypothetical protein